MRARRLETQPRLSLVPPACLRDIAAMSFVLRRSARVILLDREGRILLIRFAMPRSDGVFVFWATPGGGVEDGESDLEAARRELREELHLEIPLSGPLHTTTSRFEFEGAMIDSHDVFFVGRCEAGAPQLDAPTDSERAVLQEMRWWTPEEIAVSTESIFPDDLVSVVRRLLNGDDKA
jgi:8-oxo-dGTP diphosphatase